MPASLLYWWIESWPNNCRSTQVGVVHVEESKSLCQVRRPAAYCPSRRAVFLIAIACLAPRLLPLATPTTTTSSPSTPSPTGPSRPASSPSASWSASPPTAAGRLAIVDALRDIRSNVEDTIPIFSISGYSGGFPDHDLQLPGGDARLRLLDHRRSLYNINYSTEGSPARRAPSPASSSGSQSPDLHRLRHGAEKTPASSKSSTTSPAAAFGLNLPMSIRSRSIQETRSRLPWCATPTLSTASSSSTPIARRLPAPSTASRTCCPSTASCRSPEPHDPASTVPSGAYFSLDGTTAYVLNCGPECGGTTASVTFLQQGPLTSTSSPPLSRTVPVIANVPIPGGVTAALSDGTTLYLAGQQLQPDGLFAGASSPP